MKHAELSFGIDERESVLYKVRMFRKTEVIRTASRYIEIYVDGQSLKQAASITDADVITPYFTGEKSNLYDILRGKGDATDLPSGIAPVYVCAECGDHGCGVFGWKITIGKTEVTWHEFHWDDNLNEELDQAHHVDETNQLVIRFDKKQYFDALENIKDIEAQYSL